MDPHQARSIGGRDRQVTDEMRNPLSQIAGIEAAELLMHSKRVLDDMPPDPGAMYELYHRARAFTTAVDAANQSEGDIK